MTKIQFFIFILFVTSTLSAKIAVDKGKNELDPNKNVDDTILADVFGTPAPISQVPVVQPVNQTLVDADYWDEDNFVPASLDYDKFDWTLTKRIAVSSEDNFLLSPLGLKLALAILTEAATGPTQAELNAVLGFSPDRNVVRQKFSTIIASLKTKSSQYILNLGSRIYAQISAEPRQRFAAIAEDFYKTDLVSVDFRQPTIASAHINNWVANLTQGKIQKIIDEGDLEEVVMVILNTLYFKGSWRHQFPLNNTKGGPFYVSPTLQKQVPFMTVKEKFFYAESTKYDAKILRMPFLGNKFSMYIVVPNSLTGLPKVFSGLNDLRGELMYLQEKTVDVSIPKFHFDYTSQLASILMEMGIRQAFEDTASFPGIARGQMLSERLKVSKVLQRSGIDVNELGSVAYSATAITLVNKFGEDEDSYREIVANKPFMFFIEDENTRQLLFTGRVSDPSSADGALKLI